MPPYNQFTVICTARAEFKGETLPLEMTVVWVRRTRQFSFTNIPSTDYVTTGSPEDGYQTILTTTETDTRSTIIYRCSARHVVDSSVRGISDTTLRVVGIGHIIIIIYLYIRD